MSQPALHRIPAGLRLRATGLLRWVVLVQLHGLDRIRSAIAPDHDLRFHLDRPVVWRVPGAVAHETELLVNALLDAWRVVTKGRDDAARRRDRDLGSARRWSAPCGSAEPLPGRIEIGRSSVLDIVDDDGVRA